VLVINCNETNIFFLSKDVLYHISPENFQAIKLTLRTASHFLFIFQILLRLKRTWTETVQYALLGVRVILRYACIAQKIDTQAANISKIPKPYAFFEQVHWWKEMP
jgi:hypothetical protein